MMKTLVYTLLILMTVTFLSACNGSSSKSGRNSDLLDLQKDFPEMHKLDMKLVQKFSNWEYSQDEEYLVKDNVLWRYAEMIDTNIYGCYDLNTGKNIDYLFSDDSKLNHRLVSMDARITDGEIIFQTGRKSLTAYNIEDIMNHVSPEKRRSRELVMPDSILVSSLYELSDGSMLATIRPPLSVKEKQDTCQVNDASVVLYKDNKVRTYHTIDPESFGFSAGDEHVRWAFAQGCVAFCGNEKAVFSAANQFAMYVLDLKTGKVTAESRYSKMKLLDGEDFMTFNDNSWDIYRMQACEEYIVCMARGFESDEDRQNNIHRNYIYIFDWDLNPVKKFLMPDWADQDQVFKGSRVVISDDCRYFYYVEIMNYGRRVKLYRGELKI